MRKETLVTIIESLKTNQIPELPLDEFTCFAAEQTEGSAYVNPETATAIAQGLSAADIPTFERAVRAIEADELAWLAFKVVYDSAAAQGNTDNEVTKKYGDEGSADGDNGVFFCSDVKEIVSARNPSDRDRFQIKDVTRGPSMHTDQFDGLIWCSVPLFDSVRVWLLGASDVASEVAALARHVGFEVTAVDYDAAYLNESRFPQAHRILLDDFNNLFELTPSVDDYVCVLTRGHMFDSQGCLWAVQHDVHYVGMIGCKGKNNSVHDLCIRDGMTEEQWDRVKRPIGLKFGAKTPAELAIAIVAELIDVRYCERYSAEARAKHNASLGID